MEHKIGEIFCLEDGTMLEVAKSVCNCKDCYFFDSKGYHCSKPKNVESCSFFTREDEEFIIFKQVKDNNMEEKRNIQISLKEAKEWYKAGGALKELALKGFTKKELDPDYEYIVSVLPDTITNKNEAKSIIYKNLINTAEYLNSITPKEYPEAPGSRAFHYMIAKNSYDSMYKVSNYKGFKISKTLSSYSDVLIARFNSEEAATKAIDILGEELNILFE